MRAMAGEALEGCSTLLVAVWVAGCESISALRCGGERSIDGVIYCIFRDVKKGSLWRGT